MKKLFLILVFFLFNINIFNAKAVTESGFNNFNSSLNIGNYIQTTYYRWKCNSNNKCEKTQTKTDGDFDSESKCLSNCPSKTTAYTSSNINNNFNFNFTTTSTTKASFNSYNSSNLNVGSFKTTTNTITTLPTASTDSLSGFNFSASNLQTLNSKTTTPSATQNTAFIQPTIKSDSVEDLEPATIGKSIFSNLLQGLGIIQPNSTLNNGNILTIPKPGSGDVAPMDIKDVHYQPCEIKNLKLLDPDKNYKYGDYITFQFGAQCDYQSYQSYVQLKYKLTNDKYTYMYELINISTSNNLEVSFLLSPDDLKIINNKLQLNIDIHQCRYINDDGKVEPDPFCLDTFKNNQNDLDSTSSKNFYLKFPNSLEASNKCSYSIISPENNTTFVEEGKLKDSQIETKLLVKCPKIPDNVKANNDTKDIVIWENVFCKYNLTGSWMQIGRDKPYQQRSYRLGETTEININKYYFYLEGIFNQGDIKDCYIKSIISEMDSNGLLLGSKEFITNFGIQKCKIEIKLDSAEINDINHPYYTSKTPSIPLKMIFYCNRDSTSPQPYWVQWYFKTGHKVYDQYYGGRVMFLPISKDRITKISDKEYLLKANLPLSSIAEIMEIKENAQSPSYINVFVGSYATIETDSNGDHYFISNNLIEPTKDAKIYFYYDGETPSDNPDIQPGPTTSTTKGEKGGDDNSPKPGILKRILNFFGINLR